MEEFPLLGCLHGCTIIAASDGSLIIEGPIFTADKVNLNGWGIPSSEAPGLAKSLVGKPIRYCPNGKDVLDGVPAEHYCDATDSTKSIVGEITKVWSAGRDDKGRAVYMQQARITDPKVAAGIRSGSIPANWSLFGYAKHANDRNMMHGVQGRATTLVTEPAYTEAQFQWRQLAASFFTLNKPASENRALTHGEPFMANEVPNPNQAPAATNNTQAGGASQTSTSAQVGFTNGVPPVTNNIYTVPSMGTYTTAVPGTVTVNPNGAETPKESFSKEQVEKMIEEAKKTQMDELKRQGLAADITKLQVAAGLVENKPAVIEAKEKELVALGAGILEVMKTDYTRLIEQLQKQTAKPNEQGLGSGVIPAGASAANANMIPFGAGKMIPVPAGLDEYMDKFQYNGKGLTIEDLQKYAPGGSFHKRRG